MGSKRVGLARIEALVENLKRDLALGAGTVLSGYYHNVRALTADTTLTTADSGKIILVNPAAETTVTLPTLSSAVSGWHCTIVLTEDAAATNGSMGAVVNVDMGSGTNLANIGQVHEVDGAAGNFAVANDDFFVFTANSTPGDRASFFTDGNRWYVQAFVKDLDDSDFSANATTIA